MGSFQFKKIGTIDSGRAKLCSTAGNASSSLGRLAMPPVPLLEPSPVPDGSTNAPRYAVPAAGTRGTGEPGAWSASAERLDVEVVFARGPTDVAIGGPAAVLAAPGEPLSSYTLAPTGIEDEGAKVASPPYSTTNVCAPAASPASGTLRPG